MSSSLSRNSRRALGAGLGGSSLAVVQGRVVDKWLWRTPLITATFVSKLAIPPFGAMGISVAIPMVCAASVIGAAWGRLVVDMRCLIAFMLMLSVMWGFQLLGEGSFSFMSMLLLTVLHAPYVLRLKRLPIYKKVLDYFQMLALTIAVLGVVQYVVQFFIGSSFAFPIENYFPDAFRVSAFNMQGYLEYGSDIYRANGVFMLEPSFFSQFVAIGIVVELIGLRRIWFIFLLLAALLVSYSGTGIALLVIGLFCLAVIQKRFALLGGLIVAGGILLAASAIIGNVPYVSVFLGRAGEFSAQGSSGFARFVGGFYMFDQFMWADSLRTLVGFGAGSFQGYSLRSDYPATGMAVFKMIFEFGILGAFSYFLFILFCVSRSSAPLIIRIVVGMSFFLNGNYIPFAHALIFSLLVWTVGVNSDAENN